MIHDVKQEYIPFGKEWESEMKKMRKEDLIAMLRVELKVKSIATIGDAENFIEGTLNDFETGVSNKKETLRAWGNYTGRLMELFWKNAKNKIKNDPTILDS